MARSQEPFVLRDCALIALATGRAAQNLTELRHELVAIHQGSLYYHFWGSLLQARFEEREYNNDFAAWVRHSLRDRVLAERLAVIDPSEHADTEALRRELLELIDERLDESEIAGLRHAERKFEFVRSQIVVFDTGKRIVVAGDLAELTPHLSLGSVFYHFIDARRRRQDGCDDFSAWLSTAAGEHQELPQRLRAIDPYFVSLTELRDQLTVTFREFFVRMEP